MKVLLNKLLQKTAIFSFVFVMVLNSFVFVAQAQQQEKSVRDLIKSGLRYYDISENCNFDQPTVGGAPGTLPSTVPEPYNGIITKASQAAGIPPALLAAIWVAENSGFAGAEEAGEPYDIKSFEWRMPPPPYGTGEPWPTSYAAAKGPFQFIDGTWAAYQADGNGDGKNDVFDLTDAAFGSAKYLKALSDRADADPAKIGAGYNAGDPNSQHSHALGYGRAVRAVFDYYGGGSTNAVVPSPSPNPSPTPTDANTPSPSGVTNFNPDPAAKEEFDKTIKPKMEEFVAIYKKAAEAEKVKNWELLGAFHWMEHGLSRGTEVGGGGYITSFQLDRSQILNKLTEIQDIMGGVNADDPLFALNRTEAYTDEEVTKAARISLRLWHKENAKQLNIDLSKDLSIEQVGELAIKYKSGNAWENLNKKLHAYAWAGIDSSPEHKLPMAWGPDSPFSGETGQESRPGVVVVFGLTRNGAFAFTDKEGAVNDACKCSESSPGNGKTVFLDPGHGPLFDKIDPASGLKDKDWDNGTGETQDVWEVANNAKSELEKRGYKVVMSKDAPLGVSEGFRAKAEKANAANAAIGVSLHTTGGPDYVWHQVDATEDPENPSYRQYGDKILKFNNPEVGAKSAAYAKIFVETRKSVEGLSNIIETPHQYTGEGDTSVGNVALIMLFGNKVPWVYLEKGTGGDGKTNRALTAEEKETYTKSVIESIVKAIPTDGQAPATASNPTQPSNCANGTSAQGVGAMMDLIKQYAYEDGRITTEPKPEYKKAIDERIFKRLYVGGYRGIDCGGFVATVVDNSKIDSEKAYPGQTKASEDYMTLNNKKYQKLTVNSINDLKPGDIGVVNAGDGQGASGHIMIYTDKLTSSFNGNSANASLGSAAPTATTAEVSDSSGRGEYKWFRIVK